MKLDCFSVVCSLCVKVATQKLQCVVQILKQKKLCSKLAKHKKMENKDLKKKAGKGES